jgi:hypothetical protein
VSNYFDISALNIISVSAQMQLQYAMFCFVYVAVCVTSWSLVRRILRHCFGKVFFGNPLSLSRVIRCGRTDGRTATTNLILAFRKCARVLITFSFLHVCKTFTMHQLTLIGYKRAELENDEWTYTIAVT